MTSTDIVAYIGATLMIAFQALSPFTVRPKPLGRRYS